MTVTDNPAYVGVRHHLEQTSNGVRIRRTRDNLSMIANPGRLAVTTLDNDGEHTITLDLDQVDTLIGVLPDLRAWMTGEHPES